MCLIMNGLLFILYIVVSRYLVPTNDYVFLRFLLKTICNCNQSRMYASYIYLPSM